MAKEVPKDQQVHLENEVYLECQAFPAQKDTEVSLVLMEPRDQLVVLEKKERKGHMDQWALQGLWVQQDPVVRGAEKDLLGLQECEGLMESWVPRVSQVALVSLAPLDSLALQDLRETWEPMVQKEAQASKVQEVNLAKLVVRESLASRVRQGRMA